MTVAFPSGESRIIIFLPKQDESIKKKSSEKSSKDPQNLVLAHYYYHRVVCQSGRSFRVGLGFGPKVDQNFGLNLGLRRTYVVSGAQKYDQNNLATLPNFSDLI